LDHARDADGDVVFLFLDWHDGAGQWQLSSPIKGIRRLHSAVLALQQPENAALYVISTQNSQYQVRLTQDQARKILQLLNRDGNVA
jgi:hypothetical protein